MNKLVVRTGVKNNRRWCMLILDLGYHRETLTFDKAVIARCLDMRLSEIETLTDGEHVIMERKE